MLLHSLAFGTLGRLVGGAPGEAGIRKRQLDMTLDVMANSLVYWTQEMIDRDLLVRGSKLYGMTSAGDARVIPQYAAVSAAKATLGSHLRQLAVELAPRKIRVNTVRGGLVDTDALNYFPDKQKMMDIATRITPFGRVGTAEDIAGVVEILVDPRGAWVTGQVLVADGGLSLV
jgi:NAD(P)-dependent dehydrogenase (short-subunit alcohol dehydrogenase family)